MTEVEVFKRLEVLDLPDGVEDRKETALEGALEHF